MQLVEILDNIGNSRAFLRGRSAAARPHPPMPPTVGFGHASGLAAARVCATDATSSSRRLTPAPRPTTTTRGHGAEDGAVCGGDARRGAASTPPPIGG